MQKIRERQKILLPILKQMNAPISKHQILSFEEKYKVSLPRDYKEFISNIGNGGIGPDYGLLPLQDSIVDNKIKNSPQIDISTPFAFTNSWNESWTNVLDYDTNVIDEIKGLYLIEYRKYENKDDFKHYRAFFDKLEMIISYFEKYMNDETINVEQWIDVTEEFEE